MYKPLLTALFFCFLFSALPAKALYVSTTGLDTNPGTIDLPLQTITKALASSIHPGDAIIVRGGVFSLTTTISITPVGTQASNFYLFAYPGERPILDFSAMTVSSGNRGIQLKGNYWYLKGIDIKGAGDNGMNISGSYNIVEFCALYENRDAGMQLSGGATNNKIINCDSYYNRDPTEGNADGFAPKLDVGTNNYFFGCRSWQNSDDGYDGYLRPSNDITTIYENCWCFKNGYHKDGSASTGDGNGFKMGGSDDKTLMHNVILYNCLSFDNRVKGFDQNNNKGSMTLINCTAYNNGTNYNVTSALNTGKVLTVTNCLALGSYGSLLAGSVQTTNSWMLSPAVTSSDFISVDTSGVRGPRKPDGSLPDITYMHLKSSSHLVDAGTIVLGRPYSGNAPDIGAFEYNPPINTLTLNLTALIEALYVAGRTSMSMSPWITVELHNSSSSYALIDSNSAPLNNSGFGTFTFHSAVNGTNYYIVVKGVNSLETWSAAAQSFIGGALSYDFTTGTDKAYTDGSNPSLLSVGGRYCIYSGDVNQDGYITGDDATGIDNDNSTFDYHFVNDLNGDSYITGDDYTSIDNNNFMYVQRQVPSGAPSHLVKRVKSLVQQKSSVN